MWGIKADIRGLMIPWLVGMGIIIVFQVISLHYKQGRTGGGLELCILPRARNTRPRLSMDMPPGPIGLLYTTYM